MVYILQRTLNKCAQVRSQDNSKLRYELHVKWDCVGLISINMKLDLQMLAYTLSVQSNTVLSSCMILNTV
jgi:hypothetical protein